MPRETVLNKIYSAYHRLIIDDKHLLDVDASERSLVHRLAQYLQSEFNDWNVDCEYNRDRHEVKTVYPWQEKAEELLHEIENTPQGRKRDALVYRLENGLTVFPDIIIHHRDTDENLAVFEIKKSTYQGTDDDDKKLQAYLHDLSYEYAFKITLPTGHDFGALPEKFFAEYTAVEPPFFRKYIHQLETI